MALVEEVDEAPGLSGYRCQLGQLVLDLLKPGLKDGLHLFGNAGEASCECRRTWSGRGKEAFDKVVVPFTLPALIPVKYLRIVMCLALF